MKFVNYAASALLIGVVVAGAVRYSPYESPGGGNSDRAGLHAEVLQPRALAAVDRCHRPGPQLLTGIDGCNGPEASGLRADLRSRRPPDGRRIGANGPDVSGLRSEVAVR